MRIILAIIVISATLWSCGKEDDIRPDLTVDDLYAMTDDPADSIRHRIYGIYKNYGVSVFFNDTVGKVFVKTDIRGDSVFRYECLDPAWTYTGYENVRYDYKYMTDPAEQSRFLDMIEVFLDQCGKNLYPYSIFVVNSYTTTDNKETVKGYAKGYFKLYYKLLLLTGDRETSLAAIPQEIVRNIIEEKITDYIDMLSAFNRVSKEYIGISSWEKLGVDQLSKPFEFYEYGVVLRQVKRLLDYPFNGSMSCMSDSWWGLNQYTPEVVELCRTALRAELGKFGFVGQSVKNTNESVPPMDKTDDLRVFVKEVMRYSPDDFRKYWGEYPLVMQKYEILAGIIENELGIEL